MMTVNRDLNGDYTNLVKLSADKTSWGQELQDSQEQLVKSTIVSLCLSMNAIHIMCKDFAFFHQLSHVLDETKSQDEHLAMVNNVILTRFDFWTLGLQRDMVGTVGIENVLC